MTKKEFNSLKVGDVIRDRESGLRYVVEIVTEYPHRRCVVQHEITIFTPIEWDLVR